ncbi:DUF4181 domain-containing protein [Viridibacillus arvi]|uniref:DUF4181 domain-containing protein n=1 Tax=Viridibacillus arvi TaxID=263475 RepID=UPI00187B5BFA|nr:DUF4181 domain-containing protein [Viridibacillus sp. JNUCC-6]QOV12321.1 DUF4181 domain-containing protein [Viridibacillus sp. JNUCC-6]
MDNETLKIVVLLLIFTGIILMFGYFMRKILKVERKKWFSYNHVNDLHKKIDWSIRITFTLIFITISYYMTYSDVHNIDWYFDMWVYSFLLFIFLSESVRSVMEWKYATNPNTYIVTVAEMVLIIVLVMIILKTHFFNLLN